jgi:hypothetical protein
MSQGTRHRARSDSAWKENAYVNLYMQTTVGSKLTRADLEISKPQRNTKKIDPPVSAPRRRSRSPDYTRGGTGPSPRDNRYGGHPNSMSPRDRDRRFRDRDDYRPMRSPSPRGPARGMRPPRRHRSPSPRRDYTEDGLDLRRRLPHEVPDIQILVLNEGLPRYANSIYTVLSMALTLPQRLYPLRRRYISLAESPK